LQLTVSGERGRAARRKYNSTVILMRVKEAFLTSIFSRNSTPFKFQHILLFILSEKAALLRRAGHDTLKKANTFVRFFLIKIAPKLPGGF
jgi:hypothetical protein